MYNKYSKVNDYSTEFYSLLDNKSILVGKVYFIL